MSTELSSHERYLKQRTFGSLDGIRCAAIVAVVFHHGRGGLKLGQLTEVGFLGVDMFFVLSGFLIVTLLLREKERHARISLRDFYMRRTLRIFPLYYGVLLLYAVVFGLLRTEGKNAESLSHDLPYLLTYTANWAPIHGTLAIAWSLAAEEQFYLVWPAVEKWAPRPVWVVTTLILLSLVVCLNAMDPVLESWFGWPPDEPPMLREVTFVPILLGVLLAHLLHDRRGYDTFTRAAGQAWMPLLWAALLVLACAVFPEDLRGWPRPTLHLLMFLFVGSCVVREDHVLAKPLKLPPIVRLGTLCYGLYLLHMFVHDGVDRLIQRGLPRLLEFPATLALTWIVAELSFRFFEMPFLSLKSRFAR